MFGFIRLLDSEGHNCSISHMYFNSKSECLDFRVSTLCPNFPQLLSLINDSSPHFRHVPRSSLKSGVKILLRSLPIIAVLTIADKQRVHDSR